MSRCIALALVALVFHCAAEEPFDFRKTPGRLPKDIVPKHYAIHLAPDLAGARFSGSVKIDVEASKAAKEIVLNSLGLQITKATLDGKPITATADDGTQLLKLTGAEVTPGKHSIALSFEGKLHEKPQGL